MCVCVLPCLIFICDILRHSAVRDSKVNDNWQGTHTKKNMFCWVGNIERGAAATRDCIRCFLFTSVHFYLFIISSWGSMRLFFLAVMSFRRIHIFLLSFVIFASASRCICFGRGRTEGGEFLQPLNGNISKEIISETMHLCVCVCGYICQRQPTGLVGLNY